MRAYPEQWSDAGWCERQYNPRVTVADAGEILPRWARHAEATRARLPHQADIRYDAHPRAVYDLFPARDARGLMIFLHGGYWRALSKNDHSWCAQALVNAGYSVALVNYPLCPEVTIELITEHCRTAAAQIWTAASAVERRRCLVAGHSAGGYLTAALLATDWTGHGLPGAPFCGGLAISGVFDPTPLINTSMNELIRLTPEIAAGLDVTRRRRLVDAPLVFAVGGDEPEEFHRQSRDMARAWAIDPEHIHSIAGTNHFSIVEQLARDDSAVTGLALGLISG